MNEYMENLKKKVGYTSLKIKHAEKQARNFPSLLGFPGERSSEQEHGSLWNMEEKDNSEDPLLVLKSNEEANKVIQEQRKN